MMIARTPAWIVGPLLLFVGACYESTGVTEDVGAGDARDAPADTPVDVPADSSDDAEAGAEAEADADAEADVSPDTSLPDPGDCRSDAECGAGGVCRRFPDRPGGYWSCVYAPPTPVTGPSENPEADQCTTSATCEAGCECHLVQEYYPGFVMPHNECLCPECDTDADCESFGRTFCIPAGAWGRAVSECITGNCAVNGDCTNASGGQCLPYGDPCSSLGTRVGKHCRYPSDPCHSDADCTDYDSCVPAPLGPGAGFHCDSIACPG